MLRGGDLSTHMDGYNEAHNNNHHHYYNDNDDDDDVAKNQEDSSSTSLWNPTKEQQDHRLTSPPPRRQEQQETVARLWKLSRPERRTWILCIVTLVLTSAVQLLVPLTTGKIIDAALLQQQQHQQEEEEPSLVSIPRLLLGLFGIMSLAAHMTYVRVLWQTRAAHSLVGRLQQRLYESVLCQDMSYWDDNGQSGSGGGDALSRLVSDTDLVQTAVLEQSINQWMRGILMSVAAGSLLLYTSVRLALVALTVLPPTLLLARRTGARMKQRHGRVRRLYGTATSHATQTLSSIRTVQQFVAQDYEVHRYTKAIHRARHAAIRVGQEQGRFSAVVQLLTNGAMLGVLGYGGSLIQHGILTPGQLARFVMYALIMAGNVSGLSNTYLDLMKAIAATQRILSLMDQTPTILTEYHQHHHSPQLDVTQEPKDDEDDDYKRISWPGSSSKTTTTKRAMAVEFSNVSFAYPSRPLVPVLKNMSLSIGAGQVVALVGGSGAGKSTVAALLTRLYDVDSGTVSLDGVDLCRLDPQRDVRSSVGVVMQEPKLFSSLSIADNIRYGCWNDNDNDNNNNNDDGVWEAARLARVLEFTNRLPDGLDTVAGNLSGGQTQRVAVARCLLRDPPVVIFDEATSALDAESEHAVQQAITDTACRGRTVLLIAHRLSTIRCAHTVAVLQDGRIVETGTFDQLVSKPQGAFRQLVERQLVQ